VANTVDPRELKRMEADISQQDQEQREGGQRRQELDEFVFKEKKEIQDMKRQLNKLSGEVNPLKENVRIMEKQVSEFEKRVRDSAPDKKQCTVLQKRVDTAQATYDDANEKAAVVENQVKSCDDEIKRITGGKIKGIQKKLQESKTKLEKIKTELTKLEVEISSSSRNLSKCAEKIETMETEVTECETQMKLWNERRGVIETDGTEMMKETEAKGEELKVIRETIAKLKKEAEEISKQETELKSSRIEVDQKLQKYDEIIKENNKKVKYWKNDVKKMSLNEIPGEESGSLQESSEEELLALDMEVLTYELGVIKTNLAASKPNMAAIAEYKKKEEVYLERVTELDKMTAARDEQRKHYDDLRKQRLNDFMEGFGIITGKLKEMYQMITLGGDAELELVDSLDPFAEGIVFSVRPPKKSWKNISNLSGGEKTLSSLALVFALHYYKPTPLYVMDEIDAALDFKNVSIVANYIKERTRNAQFIIISLRSNMFELADRLVGIYKTYNCTKSVTINPNLIEETAPQQQPSLVTPAKQSQQPASIAPLRENNRPVGATATTEHMETA